MRRRAAAPPRRAHTNGNGAVGERGRARRREELRDAPANRDGERITRKWRKREGLREWDAKQDRNEASGRCREI